MTLARDQEVVSHSVRTEAWLFYGFYICAHANISLVSLWGCWPGIADFLLTAVSKILKFSLSPKGEIDFWSLYSVDPTS